MTIIYLALIISTGYNPILAQVILKSMTFLIIPKVSPSFNGPKKA
jgi:hypothetical protein